MENFKEALLIELLESELSAEKRNKLLIGLIKNHITEEEVQSYQNLREAVKAADTTDELLSKIDSDSLSERIMSEIRTARVPFDTDKKQDYKVTSVDHLISRAQKTNRFQS